MSEKKIDVNFYILKFRQLAARHQTGEKLNIITRNVDNLIKSFEVGLGNDCNYQITKWEELSNKLKPFERNVFELHWMTVISYTIKRVNIKKNVAIRRRKRRNC